MKAVYASGALRWATALTKAWPTTPGDQSIYLLLGPGQDGGTIEPEGLPAVAMSDDQRALLLGLISR